MNKIINIYLIIFISLIFSEQKIVALDGDTDDRFGQSVYISDEWVFIGANRDYNGQVNSGSVYIYVINDNMTLNFHSKIYPSDYSYLGFMEPLVGNVQNANKNDSLTVANEVDILRQRFQPRRK